MRVVALQLRDFRCYRDVRVSFGEGLTLVTGPNGAGKTNLIEGVYFGCTGRSCRTANERELVRWDADAARALVTVLGDDGPHELSVGLAPGQPKRMRVDGAPIERMLDAAERPLVSVFLPDRLELIKGPPTLRRSHVDQFVAALWPARASTRREYARALAQRNALIARIRSGHGSPSSLASWDAQLAARGLSLMRDRALAVQSMAEPFERVARELGLEGDASVAYRPRSRAATAEELVTELQERIGADLERGFTGHGPHRDELSIFCHQRDLRTYGSQGQQRLALLALLLAEREAIAQRHDAAPLMLLDDVMSELDRDRRQSLVELLRDGGQAVITATDLDHVPGGADEGTSRVSVSAGRIRDEALI